MLNGKTILAIDDSRTVRNYLRNTLTGLGATVHEAATGKEALEHCRRKIYDLILLDLMLPDLTGFEVLQQIRSSNGVSAVVVLTGMGGVKSAIFAVQQGADGYLEKQDVAGQSPVQFLYALEQALEHRAGRVAKRQLEEMRDKFYSMITHDMRNPTGAILTTLEMFELETDNLTEEQLEFLDIIKLSGEKLISLINDYLDYTKLQDGYLDLKIDPGSLQALVKKGIMATRIQARSRSQTVHVDLPDDPCILPMDDEKIQQVVDNLLSNAIKYTPQGGDIWLTVHQDETYGIFEVKDTGIGLSAEQQSILFTKYGRVSSNTVRSIRGTGLGLLIVKEVVEAHGGMVSVASDGVGKGSVFTVRLPLKQQHHEHAAISEEQHSMTA